MTARSKQQSHVEAVADPSHTLRLEVVDIEPKATHEEKPL